VIVMSLNTYDSLKLQEKKLEKEISLLDDEIVLTKKGMSLRDSVIQEKDAIILAQDVAIKEYKDVANDAIKAGEDATVNTDRCLDELKKQRFRTKFFTILGAAGGFVVGLITGILV
jgi:predicted metal-dependent peptidase